VDPATFLQMGATRAPAPAISQDGVAPLPSPPKTILWELTTTPTPRSFLYDGARLIQIRTPQRATFPNRVTNGNFQRSISDDGRFIAFASNRNLAGENGDANLEISSTTPVHLASHSLQNSSGM